MTIFLTVYKTLFYSAYSLSKFSDFAFLHPSTFIEFITKVSDIIAEPNDDFSHSHFEL